MGDFSPAVGANFTDVGEDLYGDSDSEAELAAASYGDESDSFENQGSQYDSADERSDDLEDYDESEEAIAAPANQRSRALQTLPAGAAAAQQDPLITALMKQNEISEALVTELQLMRQPATTMKLSADQIETGTQHRKVVFYIEKSLADAGKSDATNRLVLKGNAEKLFGSKQVTISSIDIHEIDNRFGVSLALKADHLPGEKLRSEATANNDLVIADCPRQSLREFKTPKRVYKSTENEYSVMFSKNFKEYNADNLADDISEYKSTKLLGKKMQDAPQGPVALVPVFHPVMSTIKLARESSGDSIDQGSYIETLKSFIVSAPEVSRAINTIRKALEQSTEATPVDKIYFDLERSNLSQQTLEKIESNTTNAWTDHTEIGTSLKDGHVKENEFKKVKSLKVTATIAFRPL